MKGGKNNEYCSDRGTRRRSSDGRRRGGITCNTDSIGAMEKFEVVDIGDPGKFAFKGVDRQKYWNDNDNDIKADK